MIKTQKKQLYKFIFNTACFVILYIFLPVCLAVVSGHPFKIIFLILAAYASVLSYLLNGYFTRVYKLDYRKQSLEEKFNLLSDTRTKEAANGLALKEKIIRYNSLKEIIEEINRNLDLGAVADSLTAASYSLIAKNKGNCILYLVDPETQRLAIFKTKKEEQGLVIKAKEGDIFDHWVLRHASPLLIEDARQDFRFDPEKLKREERRPVLSLVSIPLISEHRFLGILRLDNPKAKFYDQDDLRFLAAICDLGGVAVENSQLFQHTQDLAMHDALTRLYTKGFFMKRLNEECGRLMHRKEGFVLGMLDIDYFKKYNDRFGHTAGDIVLKRLGGILTDYLKDYNPLICRFGGEEFCFFLPGLDKEKTTEVAEGLRQRIESEKIILRRQETNITVSIGLAEYPRDAADETGLIQKADRAMYQAKAKGRNRVCIT